MSQSYKILFWVLSVSICPSRFTFFGFPSHSNIKVKAEDLCPFGNKICSWFLPTGGSVSWPWGTVGSLLHVQFSLRRLWMGFWHWSNQVIECVFCNVTDRRTLTGADPSNESNWSCREELRRQLALLFCYDFSKESTERCRASWGTEACDAPEDMQPGFLSRSSGNPVWKNRWKPPQSRSAGRPPADDLTIRLLTRLANKPERTDCSAVAARVAFDVHVNLFNFFWLKIPPANLVFVSLVSRLLYFFLSFKRSWTKQELRLLNPRQSIPSCDGWMWFMGNNRSSEQQRDRQTDRGGTYGWMQSSRKFSTLQDLEVTGVHQPHLGVFFVCFFLSLFDLFFPRKFNLSALILQTSVTGLGDAFTTCSLACGRRESGLNSSHFSLHFFLFRLNDEEWVTD